MIAAPLLVLYLLAAGAAAVWECRRAWGRKRGMAPLLPPVPGRRADDGR